MQTAQELRACWHDEATVKHDDKLLVALDYEELSHALERPEASGSLRSLTRSVGLVLVASPTYSGDERREVEARCAALTGDTCCTVFTWMHRIYAHVYVVGKHETFTSWFLKSHEGRSCATIVWPDPRSPADIEKAERAANGSLHVSFPLACCSSWQDLIERTSYALGEREFALDANVRVPRGLLREMNEHIAR